MTFGGESDPRATTFPPAHFPKTRKLPSPDIVVLGECDLRRQPAPRRPTTPVDQASTGRLLRVFVEAEAELQLRFTDRCRGEAQTLVALHDGRAARWSIERGWVSIEPLDDPAETVAALMRALPERPAMSGELMRVPNEEVCAPVIPPALTGQFTATRRTADARREPLRWTVNVMDTVEGRMIHYPDTDRHSIVAPGNAARIEAALYSLLNAALSPGD